MIIPEVNKTMEEDIKKVGDNKKHKYFKEMTMEELKDLPLSELNSCLLELFREKSSQLSPAQVLSQFRESRFVALSDIDPFTLRETEINWLKIASGYNFLPVELSPLTPLGTCSVLAHVDQNNIVSAIRGTEVVSDATNVLALQLAVDFKHNSDKHFIQKYATVHRHVRGQTTDNPKFSAHFSTFCMASGGYDTGNNGFELDQLHDHLSAIYNILKRHFNDDQLALRFYLKKDSDSFREKLVEAREKIWSDINYEFIDDRNHEYYQLIQFKVFVKKDKEEYNLADGGFVDWTQKLLSNQKHRCMISGIGIELFHRI